MNNQGLQTDQQAPETESIQETTKTRRARTGRKRSDFKKAPKPAWPVRGLWESAPQEEKERAHVVCMAILEYWLGKKSKAQVARDLEVSVLRVWQLSQKALSGMMAGLLTQPRRKVDPAIFEARGMETPAKLQRKIQELETMLARTEDMVRVLRTAPWATPVSEVPPKGGKSRAKKPKRKQTKKHPATAPSLDRGTHPTEGDPAGVAGSAG